ncbi:MAG TPA: chorismate mutase [Kaistiaceae bacterium]|nr:chorismate mutase [Kaistiaceae bacterium]
MASETPKTERSLDDLRREIDRIDADMHRLLISRGEIIDELIAVKKSSETGSAFRPAREASMLRRIAERHHGILPLDTVESIWRVIISTFTYVQAPYSVHVATDGPEMRDVARFHFGFTVPLVVHADANEAIAAVIAAKGDLGLIHAGEHNDDPWWDGLADAAAPKVIARLPFVERADHPAGRQVFVVARAAADAAATDVVLFAVHGDGVRRDAAALAAAGFELVDWSDAGAAASLLVAASGSLATDQSARRLGEHFGAGARVALVGSHAAPFRVGATG